MADPTLDPNKLIRDIRTLKEGIEVDKWELSLPNRSTAEKARIRDHIGRCQAEIGELKKLLGANDA